MARVLGRLRISRSTEESTSIDRQREHVELWAKSNDHEIVGWAVDENVSGSVDPFETPGLGPWLKTDRLVEWDILVAWKLDRVSRRVVPLNALFGFLDQHAKSLACTSQPIDLSNWAGRLVVNVIAGVAEGELEAIRERTQDSRRKLRKVGRWHGGTVPIGYQKVRLDSGGFGLAVNPETAPIVQEIAARAERRESIRSIADLLNERGVSAPRGGLWTAQTLTRMLRSRWIIGEIEYNGRPVMGDDGLPVRRSLSEPLISPERWETIQAVLDDQKRPKQRRNEPGLLLNVAVCSECGEPLYHTVMTKADKGTEKIRTYRYWRCSAKSKRKTRDGNPVCTTKYAVPAVMLEQIVEEMFLADIGDVERTEEVYVPAEGHGDEIAVIDRAIAMARREYDAGIYDGDDNAYFERITTHRANRDRLAAIPSLPARWVRQPTGETYSQAWSRMDVRQRRELMIDAEIVVRARMVGPSVPEVAFHVDHARLQVAVPGFVPPALASQSNAK
ncbi:MAG: recombinase family protein [Pseudonocardiaceae bacterium]|nr:MAG: recombinase family protein [Pseudonocardiaceae bacterium]